MVSPLQVSRPPLLFAHDRQTGGLGQQSTNERLGLDIRPKFDTPGILESHLPQSGWPRGKFPCQLKHTG